MWPSANGTVDTAMQGTTLVSADDHALNHRQVGSLVNQLPTVFGTTPGTNLLRGISAASDQLLSANLGGTALQTISKGTYNNTTVGTPAITGGTMNNGVFGTPAITGGTSNNQTVGTPNMTGGTANALTLGTPIIRAWNGWEDANETWTIVGTAAQFGTLGLPVTGTTKYQVGDPIQFTQNGTTLYMNIYGLSGTTALVTAGTTYVLGTGAITNNQYSHSPNPLNFPFNFGFTPLNQIWNNTAPTSGTVNAKFSIFGRQCKVNMRISYGTAGATNSTFQFDAIVPANQTDAVYHTMAIGGMSPNNDNAFISTAGASQAQILGTVPTFALVINTGNMSAKAVWMNGEYQI